MWPLQSAASMRAPLKGKKLLVDTVFNMVEDNDDKVNEGVNTIAPSMTMEGDTIKVELFIEEGGGNDIIGGTVKFGAIAIWI